MSERLLVVIMALSCSLYGGNSAAHRKPNCDSGSGTSDGSHQYRCEKGQWVEDVEAEDYLANMEHHKDDLVWALRTRVLNPKELDEVRAYGSDLLLHPGQTFYRQDIEKEFNDLMLTQFKIHLAAEEKLKCQTK